MFIVQRSTSHPLQWVCVDTPKLICRKRELTEICSFLLSGNRFLFVHTTCHHLWKWWRDPKPSQHLALNICNLMYIYPQMFKWQSSHNAAGGQCVIITLHYITLLQVPPKDSKGSTCFHGGVETPTCPAVSWQWQMSKAKDVLKDEKISCYL